MRGGQTPFPSWPLRSRLFFIVLSGKLCMNRDRADARVMPLNTSRGYVRSARASEIMRAYTLRIGPRPIHLVCPCPISHTSFLRPLSRRSFSSFLLRKAAAAAREMSSIQTVPAASVTSSPRSFHVCLNSSVARLI